MGQELVNHLKRLNGASATLLYQKDNYMKADLVPYFYGITGSDIMRFHRYYQEGGLGRFILFLILIFQE